MTSHKFTLVLSGVSEITPRLADAVYRAIRAEIEFEMSDGVACIECERSAKTLRQAIRWSISELESAKIGVRVLRVESESANVIAKINAELLGTASESV